MSSSPITQFAIKTLIPIKVGGIDLSFTNSSLAMLISSLVIILFGSIASYRMQLVPNKPQAFVEWIIEAVEGIVRDHLGPRGLKFMPFVISIFLFLLTGNLLGMIPYQFTFTSHIIVALGFSITVFMVATIGAMIKDFKGFFHHFVPKGTPLILSPLIVVVEVISYLSRPLSLAIRLFANMVAGHTMLKVFASFIGPLGVGGVFPLSITVALTGFEILVAILQAYVFTVLTCIYLQDAA